jgi:autotransporter-associated beta strand protein
MKARTRVACVSAAVFTALYTGSLVRAADLTWDGDPSTGGVQDISGNWNTTTPNWFNGTTNVLWSNATPDSAFLGTGGAFNNATAPHNLTVTEPITVQNLTFDIGSDGGIYNVFDDFGGGQLTIAGNVIKSAGNGTSQILTGNAVRLTAGQHTFTIRDTPGDAPELTVNGEITGAGGVTIDNGTFEQWGTTVFNFDNTYTGATNVNKGRLVISTNNGLGTGSAGVTISNQGALSVGGAGAVPASSVTISKPITVTRSIYSGLDFDDYRDAFISANAGPQHTVTLNGPIVIDSTDARFSANTSKIIISSNMQQGPNTPAAVFTADGDFAGTIALTGNNTALLGGIRFMGGVEVDVTNQNNLAGASSPLTFTGGTLHPIGGFMTDFGTHVINDGSFSGGFDVDAGQTFTVNHDLTGGSLGKRGLGTMNLPNTYNLTGGQTFFDAGTVNFTGTGTSNFHSLHLRSPVVNLGVGTIVTTNNFSSFGQDSTGTDGGPDKAVVNIFGTGALVLGNADFNVSDNANTAGTINLSGNGILHTTGGLTWLGKGTNATARSISRAARSPSIAAATSHSSSAMAASPRVPRAFTR